MSDRPTITEIKSIFASIDELRVQIDAALAVGNSEAAIELSRSLQAAAEKADQFIAEEGIVEKLRKRE